MPEGRDQVLWGRGVQAPDSHLAALSLSHVIFRTPENLRPCLDYSKKRPHLYNSVCLFSEATLWNPPQYIWPLNHSLSECLFDSGKGFFTENADQSLDRKLLNSKKGFHKKFKLVTKQNKRKWTDLLGGGDGLSLSRDLVLPLTYGGEGAGPSGQPPAGFPRGRVG